MNQADKLEACDAVRLKCFLNRLTFLPNDFEKLISPAWRPNFDPQDTAPYGVSIVSAFFDIGRSEWRGEVSGCPNHGSQTDLSLWYAKLKVGGVSCGHDAFDTHERGRNAEGNIEIAWERNAARTVTSGSHYGVLKAVKRFCSEQGVELILSGAEFLLQKGQKGMRLS
jgi:hypothetical protein